MCALECAGDAAGTGEQRAKCGASATGHSPARNHVRAGGTGPPRGVGRSCDTDGESHLRVAAVEHSRAPGRLEHAQIASDALSPCCGANGTRAAPGLAGRPPLPRGGGGNAPGPRLLPMPDVVEVGSRRVLILPLAVHIHPLTVLVHPLAILSHSHLVSSFCSHRSEGARWCR